MDLLTDLITTSGVRGTVGARIDAGSDWGWWAEPDARAAFHAVTAGTAWVGVPGHPPQQLMPGDVLLLPHGHPHALASDREALARTVPGASDDVNETAPYVFRIGSGATATQILCAHYAHDPAVSRPVLADLPDLLHVRAHEGTEDTLRLLGRELASPRIGSAVVLDHLVDILIVQILRAWLDGRPEPPRPSALNAIGDRVVESALAELHAAPARAWTTADLARAISVSRATLARRFPAAVGETPAAYLTRRRMDLAAQRLRDSDESLTAIAAAVGYTSVYAFSRAFRRARGVPPGRFRVG